MGEYPKSGGHRAIAVTITAGWSAFYLHSSSAINLSGYDKLRFWVHGGSTGNQKLQIVANGATSTTFPVTAIANSWIQVEVPFSALGSPTTLSDLYWQDSLILFSVTSPPTCLSLYFCLLEISVRKFRFKYSELTAKFHNK